MGDLRYPACWGGPIGGAIKSDDRVFCPDVWGHLDLAGHLTWLHPEVDKQKTIHQTLGTLEWLHPEVNAPIVDAHSCGVNGFNGPSESFPLAPSYAPWTVQQIHALSGAINIYKVCDGHS